MGNGNSTETKESRRSKFRHKIQNFRSRRRLHRPGSGSVSGLVSQRSVSAEDFAGIALLTLISNPNFVFNPRKKLNFPIRRQGIPKTAKSFCVRSSMSLSRPRQTLSSNWDVSGYSIDSVAQSPSRLPSFEELDTTNMLLRQRIVFLGSQMADVWSCGVTLYVMLVGAYPFEDQEDPKNFRKTIQRIMAVQYKIPDYVHISKDCKHLLSRIFVANAIKRINIAEIKKHPWFLKNLPRELTETAQAAYFRKENPTFSLQSAEEIMKIVEEAKTPARVSQPIGAFGWGGEEDGEAKEEEADEVEEEEEEEEDEYDKTVKQVHASMGEVRIS